MMPPAGWIAAVAVLALLLGLVLVVAGRRMRLRRGLGSGRTVSLDRVTLRSRRYGLTGRPDRLVKSGRMVIPEEWKSGRVLRPWHRIQVGVYCLLIEDWIGVTPPHGFVVLGDGTRHRIENTAELRAEVIELAGWIRAARTKLAEPIPVRPVPGQCRPCGMLGHCRQARP
jgi:CRISPR-associated exonuclease Cas4